MHAQFCVDRVFGDDDAVAALVCGAAAAEEEEADMCVVGQSCVRSCCPRASVYREDKCVVAAAAHAHDELHREWLGVKVLIYGSPPACHGSPLRLIRQQDEAAAVQIDADSGELSFEDGVGGVRRSLDSSSYCINPLGGNSSFDAYVCRHENGGGGRNSSTPSEVTLLSLCALSGACLLAALGVVLARRRRRRRGRRDAASDDLFACLTTAMLCTLAPFYLLLATMIASSSASSAPQVCLVAGVALKFFYLSSVAWLNCMCFEVWSSLRRISGFR